MKVALLYTHVCKPGYPDAPPAEYYLPFSKRWAYTYRRYDPGYPHDLTIVFCGQAPDSLDNSVYCDVKHDSLIYDGQGSDVGACQWAMGFTGADFVVCMSTPIYFFREGWLKRLVEAREHFGDGIYGPMASYEISPHIRTSCWAVDPKTFSHYPNKIDTRQKCCWAESNDDGVWNISSWFRREGKQAMMVTWTGVHDHTEWRKPRNIFRRGDQSNCLVRDRHWDLYQCSNYSDRLKLEIAANGA